MAFKKQRMGRKKVCYFTKNKIESIDRWLYCLT